MEVSIEFQGRQYKYTKFGRATTWVDDQNLMVPVILHTKLREEAVSSGYDISIFLNGRKELEPDKKLVSTKKSEVKVGKKSNLKGNFNPFDKENK